MTVSFLPSSKLPEVGTTIFSVMSALAVEKKAVNLGQGFPDFDCDPALPAAVTRAMQEGLNQYPPMPGLPAFRQQISDKIVSLYGQRYDPATEITVTAGATQAILTTLLACVHPGDEVIVIEPAYDSYIPSIRLAGGVPVLVSMELGEQGYSIPWEQIKAKISDKTRLLMLNSPHNPTGFVMTAADISALCEIVRGTRLLIASDEVYEHMVFDGMRHESLACYPELAARSYIISSFGKTYHVTGWKVGYVAAPAALMAEFRKVHQFNVFTVNTPMQAGLTHYMQNPAPYLELSGFYQKKRDLFRQGLQKTRFRLLPCAGTYFQSVDYSAISSLSELDFARWLTTEAGVAAIPVSAFYQQGKESRIVRFCFAKQDATLHEALHRLAAL
ncbi:pyridoxal phosphate-dependent aminotransferase [Undibacterium oligocarboniphilum]|uniref:Pyridoxal phosphate-dependent aminotransferase n=1 Tax=Undibacterium oligocarboniphilum TaxID=666702 RepID=A0A850QH25_9BURK|nr:pyridoxal phosphate-dependent aminotransferase [Undibacterium oligocarboniphilum]MBC3868764.1 pyridoxal phosphate-dependent aminotransferase [Undibacterium oligocarboniphilum]NVO76745.1 pyridoxal phosphate-dependent aminotransferase [Undibacterium oligocarboniphilum]